MGAAKTYFDPPILYRQSMTQDNSIAMNISNRKYNG
ncbi:hypothetical protein NMY3_03685 [Candidatus Nitrosocosmicus oleophilus]|uniref:Uncharacterized protein n=1 Tax=Candidatus Nitrosocosmicus oleophilus TaxID=1353260 RepID=A0A654M3N6_9ARCH|nr:hypothetical protein NMY3_03685 [Candidatus Nitrosocosmicus oleophilus]